MRLLKTCVSLTVLSTASLFCDPAPFPEVVKNETQKSSYLSDFQKQISYNPEDAYLHLVHNDTYYHLVAFSDNGDIVQLHDASKWAVHPSQRMTVLYWVQADNIFIKPNNSWFSFFSSYKYTLFNHTLQQSVEVNLIEPPLPMGAQTFRIVNIEPASRMIHLSDNTIWQIDPTDRNFPYWQIGQRIVIGLNNYWSQNPFVNIFINVDLYGQPYSQGNFFGYPVSY